jgi:hypothetical protein
LGVASRWEGEGSGGTSRREGEGTARHALKPLFCVPDGSIEMAGAGVVAYICE